MNRNTPFQSVLSQAMTEKGLRAVDVVRMTGIPKGAISYYLSGKSTPNPARLQLLCSVLGIEAEAWSRKHGHSHSRLFNIWRGMKQRCYYPKHDSFAHYGGRGVCICKEWLHSFINFHTWALENGYADHLTIDRIDPAGNYCPSNCRWVTWEVQAQNKRRTS